MNKPKPEPPPPPATAARALAKSRRAKALLCVALAVALIGDVAWPAWFIALSHSRREVVIFSPDSGTLLLTTVVSPTSHDETVEIAGQWAAQCLLDRTAAGFNNASLMRVLYDRDARLAAEKEFAEKAKEYEAKQITQTFHLTSLDGQPAKVKRTNGSADLIVTVSGWLETNATIDGVKVPQADQPVRLEFLMARNPDLVRYRQYQLIVVEYRYLPPVAPEKQGGTASR
jgi:hypothetical protein